MRVRSVEGARTGQPAATLSGMGTAGLIELEEERLEVRRLREGGMVVFGLLGLANDGKLPAGLLDHMGGQGKEFLGAYVG